MTFQFTANTLKVNKETMTKGHDKKAVAEHIKLMLFGPKPIKK
jgi:hypothetical protein